MSRELVASVNVDLAFAFNFIMDLLWFWAAGRLVSAKVRGWRVALAAALGAVLAVWAYFPSGQWISTPVVKLLGTILLFGIAYLPCRLRQVILLLFAFVGVGVAMAGLPLVVDLLGERVVAAPSRGVADPAPLLVALGVPLAISGARILWDAARTRSRLKEGLYRLRVGGMGKEVEVDGFLDTGNSLKDPLTATPVAVVESVVLAPLLPEVLLAAGGPSHIPEVLLNDLPQIASELGRFTLVPYHAVGQQGSILVAFAPKSLAIRPAGSDQWKEVKGLVAVTAERLHPTGAYQALLPPAMIES